MRLETGIQAPPFETVDIEGTPLSLEEYRGRRLWLILARFAACPFCSLRLQHIAERFDGVRDAGVDVLVVFPSKERRVQRFVEKYSPPFRVVADPDQKIFQLFGSETSWLGELRSAANLPTVFKALAATKMNPLGIDDAVHRMPSEYLIEPDGTIGRVHYGEGMDDGFPVGAVVEWASGVPAQ